MPTLDQRQPYGHPPSAWFAWPTEPEGMDVPAQPKLSGTAIGMSDVK